MSPEEVARIVHDWAVTEGLLTESPLEVKLHDFRALGASEEGTALLRKQRIMAVGFNEADCEVTVFTRFAPPRSKKVLSLVPTRMDDVKIIYRQGVASPLDASLPAPHSSPPFVMRATSRGSHYACGSSISAGNVRDAGTLGCLVRDSAGVLYGLSNNHVCGSCSYAEADLPILAPGVFDVAPHNHAPFTIGFHSRALPFRAGSPSVVDISANTDAAIFRIASEDQVTSYQGTIYDTPTSAGVLDAGIKVEKVGRTSGYTKGTVVTRILGPLPINYSSAEHQFSGKIFFEPLFVIHGEAADAFSTSGDSGSLITTVTPQGARVAVGLVVGSMKDGKAPGGEATMALAISPILQSLGVTLVSGHNV